MLDRLRAEKSVRREVGGGAVRVEQHRESKLHPPRAWRLMREGSFCFRRTGDTANADGNPYAKHSKAATEENLRKSGVSR